MAENASGRKDTATPAENGRKTNRQSCIDNETSILHTCWPHCRRGAMNAVQPFNSSEGNQILEARATFDERFFPAAGGRRRHAPLPAAAPCPGTASRTRPHKLKNLARVDRLGLQPPHPLLTANCTRHHPCIITTGRQRRGRSQQGLGRTASAFQ